VCVLYSAGCCWVPFCAGFGFPYPLCRHCQPKRPSHSAQAPGLDFSRADGTRKIVLVTVGPYLMVMLHIIVILAFVVIGAVCHMIGDKNTIYRE
jgi:hypothetical protein